MSVVLYIVYLQKNTPSSSQHGSIQPWTAYNHVEQDSDDSIFC